jgi:hypothetical protein
MAAVTLFLIMLVAHPFLSSRFEPTASSRPNPLAISQQQAEKPFLTPLEAAQAPVLGCERYQIQQGGEMTETLGVAPPAPTPAAAVAARSQASDAVIWGKIARVSVSWVGTRPWTLTTFSAIEVLKVPSVALSQIAAGSSIEVEAPGGKMKNSVGQCVLDAGPGINLAVGQQYIVFLKFDRTARSGDGAYTAVRFGDWNFIKLDGTFQSLSRANLPETGIGSAADLRSAVLHALGGR